MPICPRCTTHTNTTQMSILDTDMLCLECLEKEKNHPDYEKAREAERQAVLTGNYNFPGIDYEPGKEE